MNNLGDSDSSTDEADATVPHSPRSPIVNNAHIYRYIDSGRTMLLLAFCSTWSLATNTRSSEPEIISPVEDFFKHSAAMSTTARKKKIVSSTGLCNVAQSYWERRAQNTERTHADQHHTLDLALCIDNLPDDEKRKKKKNDNTTNPNTHVPQIAISPRPRKWARDRGLHSYLSAVSHRSDGFAFGPRRKIELIHVYKYLKFV